MKVSLQLLPVPHSLQLPPPQTPPRAEFKSPVAVTEVKVKAAAEVKQSPAVCTPEHHYRHLQRAREKRRLMCAIRCVLCNHEFTESDWSQAGWSAEKMTNMICNICIGLIPSDQVNQMA